MDVLPPKRDPVGRFFAWQTPLRREAVRGLGELEELLE